MMDSDWQTWSTKRGPDGRLYAYQTRKPEPVASKPGSAVSILLGLLLGLILAWVIL